MSDPHFEPLRGLPGLLPPGESVVWQGSPRWQSLARRAFHVRALAAYFALLLAWHVGTDLVAGHTALAAGRGVLAPLLLALAALGVLAGLAYLSARCTVYTVTTRRVVIRSGIALSVTINLPFRRIDAAQLRLYPDGTGDIPLRLASGERLGYLVNWPNVRPWHINRPEPALRAVADAAAVGELLAAGLAGAPASGAAPGAIATPARPASAARSEPVAA